MQFDQSRVKPLFCLPKELENLVVNGDFTAGDSHSEVLSFVDILNDKIKVKINESFKRNGDYRGNSWERLLCINALHKCFQPQLTRGLVHTEREVDGRLSEIIPPSEPYRNPYYFKFGLDTIVWYRIHLFETNDAADMMKKRYVLLYDESGRALLGSSGSRGSGMDFGGYTVFFQNILAAYFNVAVESVRIFENDSDSNKIVYHVVFEDSSDRVFKIEIKGYADNSMYRATHLGNFPWTISNLDERVFIDLRFR
jgi:hypothetical protein